MCLLGTYYVIAKLCNLEGKQTLQNVKNVWMLGNILKLPNCQSFGDSLKEFSNEIFHALYFIPQTSVTSSNFAIKKERKFVIMFCTNLPN